MGVAHRTPVLASRTADQRTGAQVYFKCENFQRAGAFKFRGAYNAIAQLSADRRRRGVLTHSSGNHAQAVALASRVLATSATVVMPADAPAVKLAATRGYGAEIVTFGPAGLDIEALGQKLAEERALTLVHPYDDPQVVAGQGTAARELLEEIGPLDFLLVPCGGGGLLSGSALAASAMCRGCKVIGVEPQSADDALQSFHTGTLVAVESPSTIADGARTPSLGAVTFPLVMHYVHDMVSVSEEAIVRAMEFLWGRLRIVVEPTGALAAAALLEGIAGGTGSRVGVIVSGGNVDLTHFFSRYPARA